MCIINVCNKICVCFYGKIQGTVDFLSNILFIATVCMALLHFPFLFYFRLICCSIQASHSIIEAKQVFVKGINRVPCKPLIKVYNLLSTVRTVFTFTCT